MGISNEERWSLINGKYPNRVKSIKNDSHLWNVLKIPMFMGMFLQLNEDSSIALHTRGEILNQYIIQCEANNAEKISGGQTSNTSNAILRTFLVTYALPIVANSMDKRRSLGLATNSLIECINDTWNTYDSKTKDGLKMSHLMQINTPPQNRYTKKEILHILVSETGCPV